jgi:hypothetical protein
MIETKWVASDGKSRAVGSVPAAALAVRYALAGRAEHGALLVESLCADGGTRPFRAFRYDAATRTHAPMFCGSVSSCGPCGKGFAGVLDEAGGAHGSRTRDCASGLVCAGGAAWCRGTPEAAMRCERPLAWTW